MPAAVTMNENVPFGGTVPESHSESGESCVEVWLNVDVFVHVMVSPSWALAGSGENRSVDSMDTLTVAAWAPVCSSRAKTAATGAAFRSIRSTGQLLSIGRNPSSTPLRATVGFGFKLGPG